MIHKNSEEGLTLEAVEHARQEVQTRKKFEAVEQRSQDVGVQVLEESLAPEKVSAQCGRGCVDDVRREGHEEFEGAWVGGEELNCGVRARSCHYIQCKTLIGHSRELASVIHMLPCGCQFFDAPDGF